MVAASGPDLSVVIPLKSAREQDPLGGIRAWARGQTCERSRVEILVLSNGDHPEWDAEVPSLLTPLDRFIRPAERLGSFALMDLGVREARGRWVYLCELHTEPEPDCGEALLEALDADDPDIAVTRSVSEDCGRLARAEARHYEEMIEERLQRGKLALSPRGAAVRKELLLEVGGVPTDYALFYEPLLEARLHELALRAEFVEDARSLHADQTTFRGLCIDMALWAIGEHRARTRLDPDFCDRHFGRPDVWVDRHLHRRNVAATLTRAAAHSSRAGLARRHSPSFVASSREAFRNVRRALTGLWPEFAHAGLAASFSALRFRLARHDASAWPHNVAMRREIIRAARLWAVMRSSTETALAPPRDAKSFAANDLGEDETIGFHALEHDDRGPFRWTTPAAALRIGLATGDFEVCIDTGGLRADLDRAGLAVGMNGTAVAPCDLRIDGTEIRFPIARAAFVPGDEQRLWWACARLELLASAHEERRLGVPFRSVRFETLP